jgi:hypothetical protein
MRGLTRGPTGGLTGGPDQYLYERPDETSGESHVETSKAHAVRVMNPARHIDMLRMRIPVERLQYDPW